MRIKARLLGLSGRQVVAVPSLFLALLPSRATIMLVAAEGIAMILVVLAAPTGFAFTAQAKLALFPLAAKLPLPFFAPMRPRPLMVAIGIAHVLTTVVLALMVTR